MKKFLAKQTIWNYLLLASLVLLLVGFIIFMVNMTSGYFEGNSPDALTLCMSIFAFLLGIATIIFGDKLGKFVGIGYLLVAAMVAIAIAGVCWSIEGVVGDIFFIPVNYPESEDTAWALCITSLVFYGLSFLLATASCFGGKYFKEASEAQEA